MSKCIYDLSEDCHNKDCITCVLNKIEEEINSPNRGTCDYFIVDRIEEIINKYKEESEPSKESEKCIWIKYDHRTICPRECGVENPYWRIPENMENLKYCPYCGREIEVTDDND